MILGHAAGVAAALALQSRASGRDGRRLANGGSGKDRDADEEGTGQFPAADFHTLPGGVLEAALRAEGAKLQPMSSGKSK